MRQNPVIVRKYEPSLIKGGWIDTRMTIFFSVRARKIRGDPLSISQRSRRHDPWGLYADREFHTTLGAAGPINFLDFDLENPDFRVSYRAYCLKGAVIEGPI